MKELRMRERAVQLRRRVDILEFGFERRRRERFFFFLGEIHRRNRVDLRVRGDERRKLPLEPTASRPLLWNRTRVDRRDFLSLSFPEGVRRSRRFIAARTDFPVHRGKKRILCKERKMPRATSLLARVY